MSARRKIYPPSRNTTIVRLWMKAKNISLRRDFASDEARGEDSSSVRSRKLHRGKNNKKRSKIYVYLFLIILGVSLFLYFVTSRKYWDGEGRLTLAVQKLDGDVNIVTFDPKTSEIFNIRIPGSTEVEVANQLGVWKLKSVWELSMQENLEGSLL